MFCKVIDIRGDYAYVQYEDTGVISEVATVTLKKDEGPVITIQPQSVAAAEGENVSLTVKAEGTELKYQWQYSKDKGTTWVNCTSGGATTATFAFAMKASVDGRQYRCKVVDGAGSNIISNVAIISLK